MKITKIIKSELDNFSSSIEIIKGKYSFNWHKTVERITLYQHDRFLENDEGLFWNIASPQSEHFNKNLDLDTKDFHPQGKGKTSFYQAFVLKVKFEKWAREARLSKDINSLLRDVTNYGFGVWKRVPDDDGETIDKCDLRNIYFDVCDKKFKTVIEKHELTEMEIRDKDGAWDNIEQAVKNAKKISNEKYQGVGTIEKYQFYERVGEFKDGKKYKYMHHIVCGEGDKEVIVFEEEIENNIYHAFSLNNASGRLPGIGIYERLFKLQERANTLVNENSQTTAIASLLLLRTQDSNLSGNVLEDVLSGEIINSTDLQQIGIDNRFLNGFVREMQMIEDHAKKLCMTPEVVTGENLPSGTPFRSMASLTVAAKSAFKIIREDIGTQIADILIEYILPELAKKWNKEELLEISENEEDIRIYDDAVVNLVKLQALTNNPRMTEEELDKIEKDTRNGIGTVGRKIKTPKGFFNFKYGIIINPVNENYDKAQQNETAVNAITMISQNPALMNIPLMKWLLENNGISWWKLNAKQMQELQQSQQQPQQNKMPEQKANMLKDIQV